MSEKYEAPKAEVVKFETENVICTSGCGGEYTYNPVSKMFDIWEPYAQ